jgi:EAL domain-containing protein (putative c-di-GMP-specific phosphodiesterase class I)
MPDLTRAVILDGLRQTREWRDAGLPLRMSINVSMKSLSSLEFPDFVARAIAATGVTPESLVLEITESKLADNPLAALDIVTRLRLKHIGLSIDDFGTGQSSLAQLRDLPFDELKIDQGFVRGAVHDPAKMAIVEANLHLARQLHLRTVGEGIEEREDWDLLRQLGCDVGQGWFMAKAMPAAEIPGWMAAWEARRAELVPAP